ncbi:hypothetical protein ACJW30_01G314600 [Castanea mollissima]
MRILWPLSCFLLLFIGRKPRKSWHTFSHSFCVLPDIVSPSTGSPRRTSTFCNVMVTSPCGMWKV